MRESSNNIPELNLFWGTSTTEQYIFENWENSDNLAEKKLTDITKNIHKISSRCLLKNDSDEEEKSILKCPSIAIFSFDNHLHHTSHKLISFDNEQITYMYFTVNLNCSYICLLAYLFVWLHSMFKFTFCISNRKEKIKGKYQIGDHSINQNRKSFCGDLQMSFYCMQY